MSRIRIYQVRGRVQQAGEWSSLQIGGHCRSRLVEMKPMLRALIAAEVDLILDDWQQRLA